MPGNPFRVDSTIRRNEVSINARHDTNLDKSTLYPQHRSKTGRAIA
jgi:hypothetical protein